MNRNAELYYSARDLAVILSGFELDCQSEAEVMERIWEKERLFLQERYRADKLQLLKATLYWENYLWDKSAIDAEFPTIQKDMMDSGGSLDEEEYLGEFTDLDLFFKSVRLRILYGPGNDYVRVKRRTLLSRYGFKRMSPPLLRHMENCLRFYRLGSYIRGGVPCQIKDTQIDDMIVFRIAADKGNRQGVNRHS